MKTIWKASALVLLVGALFTLGGCLLGPNVVLEGPGGLMALVLEDDGAYEVFPEGGALWLLAPDGTPQRVLLPLGEEKDARPMDWLQGGNELLVLASDVGEFGFPERWRLMELPLDGEPVELVVSEDPIFSARYGVPGTILFTQYRDEGLALVRSDRASGEEDILADDVLAFLRWEEGVYVLGADGALRAEDGQELPLQIVCDEEDCDEAISIWPSVYLDVSSCGRYVAIALEQEPRLLLPETGGEPSLYLVDLQGESATHLATPGLYPAFSPDGSSLAFIGAAPDGPEYIYLHDLLLGQTRSLDETQYAMWIHWGPGGIVFATETALGYELRRWADDVVTVLNIGAQ